VNPVLRSAATVLGALALLAPAQAVASDGPGPGPEPQLLVRPGHGAAVVQALGDRLPAAAATNRMSPSRLAGILENDHTAWVGADGRLFYKEAAATLAPSGDTTPVASASTYPASQTFALHSNALSTHTIFLDFDGATVSGTWWNEATGGGMPSRFYTGFTLDSDPTTFTAAELTYIQQVWQIVAEKYAPFDVDVTTQDPGSDGYNRSSALDPTYGDHVIITNDSGAVTSACGGSCSGVALVGTFNEVPPTPDYFQPAWVFSSMTYGSAVLTAHTVAHEVGHTFGLQHDGDATHAYSDGHGNWFPLMGSSARAVGQFSKGEYAGANNTEDDLAVIASNGAPLRVDDHSDALALAEPLAPGTLVDGVISTSTDQDVFVVSHSCTTDFTARATGIGAGASLDMSVTVLSSNGTVLGTSDPISGQTSAWPAVPTGMDAKLTVAAAPAGLYYVRVDGVGKGSPLTDGYSDYASLGYYQLAVSTCDGALAAPTTTIATTTGTTVGMPGVTTTGGTGISAPSAPGIGRASSGRRGGPVTATVRWSPPASNGGAAIVGYQVRAERIRGAGRVVKVLTSRTVAGNGATLRLHPGRYRFRVVALNAAGSSPYSATSRVVIAR
jgi:hypothetical protein